MAERPYDIVLLGATGFTGGLTAEYLAANAPAGASWALAGRSIPKLEAVRERLVAAAPADRADALADLPLLRADTGDAASMRELAESTKVLVTTVGPYIQYGEPVVAACAAAGTGYLDLTGEPEFADLMYLRHHRTAVDSGARLLHACGFDSIPYDLGALYTVQQLPEGVPVALQGFVRAGGTVSGGTFHSAVGIFAHLRQSQRLARQRREVEQREAAAGATAGTGSGSGTAGSGSGTAGSGSGTRRRVRGVSRPPHYEPLAGGWVVPAPTIDPQIVLRSARALDRYGPDFSYSHYIVTGTPVATAALVAGAGTIAALAQLKPTRELLLKWKDPGEGPSPEKRAKSWFRVRMVAEAPGTRVTTEVSGGDPGYGETAKMLAEAAMCMALDDVPSVSGQSTTAVALGQPLIDRLIAAGIRFQTVEP